ncbi:MAG: methionine--tRNA ligase [Legionellales bacterium RIFCSPHIGHO2_12_FULL_37_14]|nr:MAG: methionine--tRNA ligase [Legionellales bacterium RIFCSPHIGHO2_12_FULL_37_14]
MTQRTMLVTCALPYANGHLHLGHFVEHIQADIWIRTQRLLGNKCLAICGVDAHGTPIMLKAEQQKIKPELLTNQYKLSHETDFKSFGIYYDSYSTTNSHENQVLTEEIYTKLKQNADILQKTIAQAFDAEKNMFLPDRYIKGTCPRCKATNQYGDNCEVCGASYHPSELVDPVSILSNTKPITKESVHYFFNLPKYEQFLKAWTQEGHLQTEMANKLAEWFSEGLKTWDISRDAPYFGFLIPDTKDKYFYVWLDAPIGYMASCQKYCQETGATFADFWQKDSSCELYHFVGKDILYFHALFWPAVLYATGYRLPTAIYTHGFLTINGKKMSKSRGTFIEAKAYLKHLNPQYLRYYFAAKLNGKTEDIDLNFADFILKINADLVGKVVNIASRSCGFLHKFFAGELADSLHNEELYNDILRAKSSIIDAYINRDYASAIRLIMDKANLVNQYIDAQKPWILAKESSQLPLVQKICTTSLNLFKLIITYLKPVLPVLAEDTEKLLNIKPLDFVNSDATVLNQKVRPFETMLERITEAQIHALLQEEQ